MLLRKKEEIETWLNQYNVENYTLIKDEEYGYVVNIKGDVDLCNKKLKNINIKFNEVQGSFDCRHNKLTLLEGCPDIVNGSFNCSFNKLNSLKYSPKIVNDNFSCSFNKLTTLEGGPEIVTGVFYCYKNKLESLKGLSKIIGDLLVCSNNELSIEGLKYLPQKLKKNCIEIMYNIRLGELQYINNFKVLKERIKPIVEKENLLKLINKKEFKTNKYINKI